MKVHSPHQPWPALTSDLKRMHNIVYRQWCHQLGACEVHLHPLHLSMCTLVVYQGIVKPPTCI